MLASENAMNLTRWLTSDNQFIVWFANNSHENYWRTTQLLNKNIVIHGHPFIINNMMYVDRKRFNKFNARVYLNRKESGIMVDDLDQAVDIQLCMTGSAIQTTMPPFSIIVRPDCLPINWPLVGRPFCLPLIVLQPEANEITAEIQQP